MNLPFDMTTLLAAFASAFSQENRALEIFHAPGNGFAADSLLPLHLHSEESLSEPGHHRITALSADAAIEVKSLVGKAMGISIRNPDGSYRPICGIVNRVSPKQSDGGFAQYDIELVPSIDLLKHSRNSRTFQQKSVPEIAKTLLNDLRANHPSSGECFEIRDELTRTYPPRDYTLQYRESTFAFITRLLREEGISYRIEHEIANDMPLHRIVFFDDAWDLPETEYDSGNIRFHRNNATEETNNLDFWESERAIQSSAVSHSSWNYRRAATDSASESAWIENGESAPSLEDYDAQTHHYGNETDLTDYAAKRQQAYDLKTKTFFAAGNITHLNLGNTFTLQDHPVHDQDAREQRQFVVLGQTIDAWNNLPDGIKALSGEAASSKQENPFRTKLTLARRGIPIVPEYSHTEHAKPTSLGPQTATVVGPAGHNEVFTNERGEIKIQFPWQRPQDHGVDYTGSSANFDEYSSIWIRVAHDNAGDGWGSQYVPRVGQEVLVIFLENDIDRPVVIKVLHNARHANPTFSGTGSLPANRTLSGFKSKEFDGHGYNEILSDDTTNELRQKISSEHAKTQLNLGYLIHPRTEGKGEPRGEGIEVRTDAAIALRGAWGILLSADARYMATGKQLDRQEFHARLNAGKELLIAYGDLANTHHADNTEFEALKGLIERVANWEKGSNTDKNGTNGCAPIIALTAPADIAMSSGEATAITTGTNLDLITQQSTQITAGKNFVARVKERISFFTYKMGIKIVAAAGRVEIQAHSDNIEMTTQKKIILTALEEIILKAPKVTIITDGASYEIGGGKITTKTIGTHTQHAAYHNPTGPASMGLILPAMPVSQLAPTDLLITHLYHDDEGVQGAKAIIKFANGGKREALTNAAGEAVLKDVPPGSVQVTFKPDARARNRIDKTPNDATSDTLDDVLQRRAPAKKERS